MKRSFALACLALSLAGCAGGEDHFPSLLPRPIESRGDAEPAEALAVAAPDAALDAQIATQRQALTKAASDFGRASASAERLTNAASGAAPGTDAWLDAQTALGTVDDAHGSTQAVVSALEALAIDRAAKLLPPYSVLDDVQSAAAAQSDREAATIKRLQARLKPAG